jgi:hypothetical protein
MKPSGRNRWRPAASGRTRKPLKQADPQAVATHDNRFAGMEGVDSSSPSVGFVRFSGEVIEASLEEAGFRSCFRQLEGTRVGVMCLVVAAEASQ